MLYHTSGKTTDILAKQIKPTTLVVAGALRYVKGFSHNTHLKAHDLGTMLFTIDPM